MAKLSLTNPIPAEAQTNRGLPIGVRARIPEDVPHLHRIEIASFPADPWTEDDFLNYDCLVAVCAPPHQEVNPRIVGFVISHEIYSPLGKELAEREILNLAVDPEFRGHGVGRLLLAAELERGGTHFLEVRESNVAALQLYERHGFEIVGRREEYYDNPLETAVLMRHPPELTEKD